MAEYSSNGTELADIISKINLALGVTGLLQLPVILTVLLLMIFVYKTYRSTFQRLILYFVLLGLWLQFSYSLQILLVYTEKRWVCIIEQFFGFSSLIAYYTYIVAITNFSLLLIPCLMRGRPVSKRISKCVEYICVVLTLIIALMGASIAEIKYGVGCTNFIKSNKQLVKLQGVISMSIFFGVDVEVVLVCLSLCFAFCFIRQRIRIRQTGILLRNSVCHVAINAVVMGVDAIGIGYDIYMWSTHKVYDSREFLDTTAVLIWNVLFTLVVGVSVLVQAVLCIQTSAQGSTCCKRCCHEKQSPNLYVVIDGKDVDIPTNPASSRVSQPSYTNFAVPYTGGFTQASTSTNNDGHSENGPRSLIE